MIGSVFFAAALAFSPETALRAALDGDAEWTMERTLPGTDRTLVSSGTVHCAVGTGIVWKTVFPFESSVTMTTNAMIFADEEGVREKALSELPHYAEIRRRTDAFAAGEFSAFEGLFRVETEKFADGGWRLKLEPEVRQMERLMKSVELYGARLPTNAVMQTGDGGVSRIFFRERRRDR